MGIEYTIATVSVLAAFGGFYVVHAFIQRRSRLAPTFHNRTRRPTLPEEPLRTPKSAIQLLRRVASLKNRRANSASITQVVATHCSQHGERDLIELQRIHMNDPHAALRAMLDVCQDVFNDHPHPDADQLVKAALRSVST